MKNKKLLVLGIAFILMAMVVGVAVAQSGSIQNGHYEAGGRGLTVHNDGWFIMYQDDYVIGSGTVRFYGNSFTITDPGTGNSFTFIITNNTTFVSDINSNVVFRRVGPPRSPLGNLQRRN